MTITVRDTSCRTATTNAHYVLSIVCYHMISAIRIPVATVCLSANSVVFVISSATDSALSSCCCAELLTCKQVINNS